MAYATLSDVQARLSRQLSDSEQTVCASLLEDAAIIIDSYKSDACVQAKQLVSCRMVIRALGDGDSYGVPVGATQGNISALGYSQGWTIGSGGGAGEIYLGKAERRILGLGDRIGSYSPVEELCKVSKVSQ